MITRDQKKEIVKDLSAKFLKSKAIVFLSFQGLTAKENIDLRKQLRVADIDYKVARKTLIRKSLEEAEIIGNNKLDLEGPVAVAVGYDDEVSPARITNEYSKENKKIKLLGGFVETNYLDAIEIKSLALLPSKEQLRAQLVGTINAPVSGFVNTLTGNLRGLVNVLKAVGENKNSD